MAFLLHQALYGYDRGHQQIASSVQLPPEARNFLAVATDMSGSPPRVGFEKSVSGTPVPATAFYALFCTWLATEMPRPGCVWTHVLLIEFADLATLAETTTLVQYFRRPERRVSTSYSVAINHQGLRTGEASKSVRADSVSTLIAAVYSLPDAQVLIAADDEEVWEGAVLSLWSQQWPRLRRGFRFSTGSFADRGRDGVAYDVQITPSSNLRAWNRDKFFVLADNFPHEASGGLQRTWISLAVEDAVYPNASGFREFARTFGADIGSPRHAFAKLAAIFWCFRSEERNRPVVILEKVATYFPSPSEAKTLKNAVLLFSLTSSQVTSTCLFECVHFLYAADSSRAFAENEFSFGSVVGEIWKEKRAELLALLRNPPTLEKRWRILLDAIARQLSGSELPEVWRLNPDALAFFVEANPQLAYDERLWHLPDRAVWAAVDALELCSHTVVSWAEIICAMLSAGCAVAVSDVVHNAGSDALNGVLLWLQRYNPPELPSVIWRELLRPAARQGLRQEPMELTAFALCLALAPQSVALKAAERPEVTALAERPLDLLPIALRAPMAFLLLAIGLRKQGEDAAKFIGRGVFRVYRELLGREEPPEGWRLIQSLLPRLWPWEEWDRCERLRRGILTWLKRHPGCRDYLRSFAENKSEIEWIEH